MVRSVKCPTRETTIENCTGPVNWGEAHCAGEKVKRKREDQILKSHQHQTPNNKNKAGRSPPRQPGTPRLAVQATRSVKESEKRELQAKVMNWGEACFAGKTVRHTTMDGTVNQHQQGARPATESRGQKDQGSTFRMVFFPRASAKDSF